MRTTLTHVFIVAGFYHIRMRHIVNPEECYDSCLGRLSFQQELLVLLIALCVYLRERGDECSVITGTSFECCPVGIDPNDLADQVREICRTRSRAFPERRLQVLPMIDVNEKEGLAGLPKIAPCLRKCVRLSRSRM